VLNLTSDQRSSNPGTLPRSAAPDGDALEALWRTYYASTFNPARVRTNAMRAEMPVRYWRNLPEAAQIGELVRDAPTRVKRMVEKQGLPPELARPPRRSEEGAGQDAMSAAGQRTRQGGVPHQTREIP
jgi:uracil-DNA glycosylase